MAIPDYVTATGLPYAANQQRLRRRLGRRGSIVSMPVEDGPDLQRRQGNTELLEFDWERTFSHAQRLTFDTFVRTTLLGATLHFTMPVQVAGSAFVTRRCYIRGGIEAISDQPAGSSWIVTMPLTVFVNVAS